MRWRVLLFAGLRDRVGREALEIELPGANPVSAGQLRAELVCAYPELDGLVWRLAVDAAYVADGDPVPPGAELAAIPPVSGG